MIDFKKIPKLPVIFLLALTGSYGYLYWHKRAIFTETTAEKDKVTNSQGRYRGGHGVYRTYYHK